MTKHRSHSAAFKRQVAQEFEPGAVQDVILDLLQKSREFPVSDGNSMTPQRRFTKEFEEMSAAATKAFASF